MVDLNGNEDDEDGGVDEFERFWKERCCRKRYQMA